MARVDVIVPCYNYGHFLEGCVESALRQEGVDVRVLIIDDASPDDTEVVGRRLAERDPRVTYRRHAVNQGHIATYNEGLLEWADGDYALRPVRRRHADPRRAAAGGPADGRPPRGRDDLRGRHPHRRLRTSRPCHAPPRLRDRGDAGTGVHRGQLPGARTRGSRQ